LIIDSILEIKKEHVSAYHWPSSGFISEVMLQECYTFIANYCKSVTQLLQIIARVLYNYCKLLQTRIETLKKYLMVGACGTSGAEQSCLDVFWGNTEERHQLKTLAYIGAHY
jgi:hypothetical protein